MAAAGLGAGGASAACARGAAAARRGAPSRRAGLISARVARGRPQHTAAAAGAAADRQVACMARGAGQGLWRRSESGGERLGGGGSGGGCGQVVSGG